MNGPFNHSKTNDVYHLAFAGWKQTPPMLVTVHYSAKVTTWASEHHVDAFLLETNRRTSTYNSDIQG